MKVWKQWLLPAFGLLLVAGCGHTDSHQGSAEASFHPDQATWHLPLDDYQPGPTAQQKASKILYTKCMQRAGFTVPFQDPSDNQPPNRNRVERKLFNLSFAEKYGYHSGPTKASTIPPPPKLSGMAKASDVTCTHQASSTLGEDADLIAFVQGLAWNANGVAIQSPVVQAANARWHTCMLPQGIPDLPDFAEEMPTLSEHAKFGMAETGDGAGTLAYQSTGSPMEIRAAVFDAQCRISSGFSATYYTAEVQAQFAAMGKNQAKLDKALEATRQEEQRVDQLLTSNGS
jgi:hypothetical protein